VHSLAFACSDAFAYDNGTYQQTANGQPIEGNYLVVLFWKDGKWMIMQHASTAKGRPNQPDSLADFHQQQTIALKPPDAASMSDLRLITN